MDEEKCKDKIKMAKSTPPFFLQLGKLGVFQEVKSLSDIFEVSHYTGYEAWTPNLLLKFRQLFRLTNAQLSLSVYTFEAYTYSGTS